MRSASDEVEDVLLVLPEDRDQYVTPEDAEPVNVYALNPKYTFDSFVVGSSNQFPHAAAQAVAQTRARPTTRCSSTAAWGLARRT